MKRMIFIRIALPAILVVAAMTFMGTVSVSAQSFYTPSQASAVTEATLNEFSQPTVDKTGPASSTTSSSTTPAQAPTVTNNSVLASLKVAYLLEVRINLKSGLDTQAAINQVYDNLVPSASVSRLTQLGATKAYVVDLLSN